MEFAGPGAVRRDLDPVGCDLPGRGVSSTTDAEIAVEHSVTRLRVAGVDLSAVHGIGHRIEALGLELLDLHPSDPPP